MARICITFSMLFVAMFFLSVVAQYPTASPKASVVITIGTGPSIVNSLSPITPPSVSPSLPPSSISSPPAHAPAPHKSGAASHGFSFAIGTFVVALVAAALII
ncbi:hypothetical protein MtrunA17_Chr1g0210781 [Medicago truncatula]|uniref:Transmembrane protein, putative n=1 Tax=Medicago truncatula TaxID=3880 RepID=A0A072VQP7_MEDTR|nr:transmembrane protein, putative [Medicago truncatula]RHN82524.1 hypothetical protein MtrunA17_Chr1g0210781 [Medicago truncatula]